MLLQVVADAGDVGGDLDAGGQADARDLAESRVRLLRGLGVDAHADAAPLGRAPKRRRLRLRSSRLAPKADQLLDGRQRFLRIAVLIPRGISRLGDKR